MSERASKHLSIALLILFACPLYGVCQARAQDKEEAERREAQRVWDAVVKVKGGRERLHGVRTLLVESGQPANSTWLFAFPDKYWVWTNEGPGPRRWSSMLFYNGEPNAYYWITSDGVTRDTADPQRRMDRETALYLLETESLRPEPLRVTRVRDGKRLLDVIETRVSGERLDFAVEVEQLLVLKVMWYGRKYTSAEPLETYLFTDYAPEDGIQMPHGEQMLDDGDKLPKRTLFYRLNVEYESDFFKQPPPLAAGSDAWKPGRQLPSSR